MKETCEVCGTDVAEGEIVRAELSIGEMMCPTPMSFHRACYEQASNLWKPNLDSTCIVDNEFPETAQWTPVPGAGAN